MSGPANSPRYHLLVYATALVVCVVGGVVFLRPPADSIPIPSAVALGLALLLAAVSVIAVRRFERRTVLEVRRRTEAERALSRTSQLEALATALSRAQTPPEVTRACLFELLHAVGASAGALTLVEDDAFVVLHSVGYSSPEAIKRLKIPLAAKTALTEVVRGRMPVFFASQAELRETFPGSANDPLLGPGGVMIVPLVMAGRGFGALVFGFQQRHQADEDERNFAIRAAACVAPAMIRARRFEVAERARAEAEAFRVRADVELRERQKAEEALRESEARYRALAARTNRLYALSAALSESITLEAVARAVVRHGKIVAGASAALVALVGEGRQFETLFAEEYPRQILDAWRRFPIEPGSCATAAVEARRAVYIGSFAEWQQQYPRSASIAADGGYASAAALPLVVEGSAIGVLWLHFTVPVNFDDEYRAVLASVSQHAAQAIDRARLYETAQRARADAEAANRAKDDFLSIVSHELRTPLSAVLGWAAILRDHVLDPARARRAIEAIYTNATRQAHLIDELLDVSRIVAGRAPLDLQDVDLAANVRGAVEAVMPLAESKGVQVHLDPLPAEIRVVADPRRLEQVFMNLLGNAVKFTPEGGRVTVDVATSEREIAVRVSDTGRGIDPAFLPHVFERFRQAESTAARTVGGLGLGLFIARRLIDAHGGEIRVESEGEGRGATFTVTLPVTAGTNVPARPATKVQAPRIEAEALPSLNGVRVLVVDDEADVREMMTSVLETCGATVLSAHSAEDALETLTGGGVDVLLADIAMPGKDGCALIREVRARPVASVASIPAAAVTACAREDERQRALADGFQMHLAKPITPAVLARTVATLAHAQPEGRGVPSSVR